MQSRGAMPRQKGRNMNTVVYTDRYERAYGKMPRGYGNWCFSNRKGDWNVWYFGKYSEAKKAAVKAAKEAGILVIYTES